MPLKNVHYQKLETEDSEGEEDESPPTHLPLQNSNHVKGTRWNHIDNLDEFFERVYLYHQNHGLLAITLTDIMELFQFLFIIFFSTFLVTCLKFHNLFTDKITYFKDNRTNVREVLFSDLFDESRLLNMHPLVVLILLLAMAFWVQRLYQAGRRFFHFWEIRTFYHDALGITTSELRDLTWGDVLVRLKDAQREHKMNIRKQELTELDVYHRILRFKNYLVAMVNKSILPCKIHVPFYGEKVFFTHGLKLNYELILFWGPGAPFRNSFYLQEDYKSASKRHTLISNLKFRITVLALLNLIFCPFIFLYQILYSFFHYAEFLKRQPGVFGKRKWSLYGRYHVRDLNELDHELALRLNRAYLPAEKYVDLFTHPIITIFAQNIAFVAGSVMAVLLVMTIIQEDLLTAHNVLTIITLLGVTVTICRVFIPDENQVWIPAELMHQILGEIHYMPDHWKQRPHTAEVYKEFTQIFQFTLMYILDELLSPLITPFILYFCLRAKAPHVVDFLRNFTIDVSGVGDVCSFAEMNVKKHGNPEWLTPGMTRATDYEKAELGKTEISLMHFSRKNPNWKPNEDGAMFMTQLRESVEEMQKSQSSAPDESLTYISLHPSKSVHVHEFVSSDPAPDAPPPCYHQGVGLAPPTQSMQWSVWSVHPTFPSHPLPSSSSPLSRSDPLAVSTMDTLQMHQLHDYRKAMQTSFPSQSPPDALRPCTVQDSAEPTVLVTTHQATETELQSRSRELRQPLLQSTERELVVENTSSSHSSGGGDGGGGGEVTDETALNMHDDSTHQ